MKQHDINRELWSNTGAKYVAAYAAHPMRRVEEELLEHYAQDLRGRVLEIGVGAGRLTQLLVGLGGRVTGIDVSPAMVEHCRRTVPQASFHVLDLRDLSPFQDASFDALLAGFNVIDVLGDEERGAALDEWRRVLAPGGLLILSSHNLRYAGGIPNPGAVLARNPLRLAKNLRLRRRRVRNHARLAPLERREESWAILNDQAHDFGLLHYYATRDENERRLAEHGFALVDCLDLAGALVGPGEAAATCPELHYVARPAA